MKKALLAMALVVAMGGVAFADEPAPMNDPQGFYEKAKAIIESSEPRVSAFLNVEAGEWQALTAAKLYSKDIKGYTLEGVIGYGVNKTLVGSIETDVLAGISKLTGAKLEIPWVSLNVGPAIGYGWDSEDFVYGAVLNASAKF